MAFTHTLPGTNLHQHDTVREAARRERDHPMSSPTAAPAINCDFGPAGETATRVGDGDEPLCDAHAKEHYGPDWRTETRKLGVRAAARLTASAVLPAGTVVTYHGSIASEHGEKVVIGSAPTAGYIGYTLRDRDYPDRQFELQRCRRASITPTGTVLTLTDRDPHGATPMEWGDALVAGTVRPVHEQLPLLDLGASA